MDDTKMKTLKKMLLQKAEEIAILQADLRAWVRLGKIWRKSIPTNYALCPSDAGIEASESLVGPVKEPEEYEIHDVLKEIRMEYVDVRIQNIADTKVVVYQGPLHPSLIQIGMRIKKGPYIYTVKDIYIDIENTYVPVVMMVNNGYRI